MAVHHGLLPGSGETPYFGSNCKRRDHEMLSCSFLPTKLLCRVSSVTRILPLAPAAAAELLLSPCTDWNNPGLGSRGTPRA